MNKDRINQILQLKGEVRSSVFQTDKNYVLTFFGEEGLERLIEKANESGVEIPYEKTNSLEWYPAGLRIISLLLIKEIFNLTDEEIKKMGYLAPKTSFIVKSLLKFFINIDNFTRKIPDYWKEHWSIGDLKVIKMDKDDKTATLYLHDFNIDPVFCIYETGFFEKMFEFVIGGPVNVKELKCMSKGDKYHEFSANW